MESSVKILYCKKCKKDVKEPISKEMDTMTKSIWVIAILATLGIALIPFTVFYVYRRKARYCPVCNSKLKVIPFVVEDKEKTGTSLTEALTAKEKVVEKVKKIQEKPSKLKEQVEEEKYKFCEFCGEKVLKTAKKCPNCKSIFKE